MNYRHGALAVLAGCLLALLAAGGAAAQPGQHEVNVTDGSGTVNATYHYNGSAVNVQYADGSWENSTLSNPNESALTIQWAVENTTAANDTVVIGQGTYNGSIEVQHHDRTIRGIGGTDQPTITPLGSFGAPVTGVYVNGGDGGSITNVTVSDGYSQAFQISQSPNFSVTGVEATGTGHGIYLFETPNVTIDRATIDSVSDQGIRVQRTDDVTVTNTTIDGANEGIVLRVDSDRNLFADVSINDTTTGIADFTNVQAVPDDNRFIDAAVTNSTAHGIDIQHAHNTTFTNTTSRANGGAGLRIANVSRLYASELDVDDNAGVGVNVTNATNVEISDSSIHDNSGYGILFYERVDSSVVRDSTVSGHNISVGLGILFDQSFFGSDNRIVNNTFRGEEALELYQATNTTVLDNDASGNGNIGIQAYESSHALIENNTVQDFESGIFARGDRNTVRDNVLTNTSMYGIDVGSSSNTSVSSNTITDARYGISLFSTEDSTLRSNNVTGSETGIDLQDTIDTTVRNTTSGNHLYQAIQVRGTTTGATLRNVTIREDFATGIVTGPDTSNLTLVDSEITSRDTNVIANGSGHEFRNVTLDGDETGFLVGGSNVSIRNATVVDQTVGLAASNASNLTVDGGTWARGETGMRIWESDGTRVRSALVAGANQSGIRIQSSGDVTLRNATVRDNAAGGSYWPATAGIVVNDSSSVTLDGSHLRNNSHYGIFVYQSSRNVTIQDTQIVDIPNYGVDTNAPTTFRNVTVAGNEMTGLDLLAGSTVVDSIVRNNGDIGIAITRNATFRDVVSVNNSAEEISYGGEVTNGSNVTASSIPFESVNGTFWTINDSTGSVPEAPGGTEVVGEAFNVTGLTNSDAYGDAVIDYGELGTGGIDESTISLYRLNVTAGSWESVSGGSVDASADTYAFNFTHGQNGTYRLHGDPSSSGGGGPVFIPAPPSGDQTGGSPSFTISELDLDPAEIAVGETVTVSLRVDNDGDADGTFTGNLTADGEVVDTGNVSVNQNYHATLELTTSFDEPGTYDLAVNGESVGTAEVTGEATFSLGDVSLGSSDVAPGDTVTITVPVTNDGSAEGSIEVPLIVDGEQVDSRSVTLGPGESTTVSFEHTFEASGSQPVSVAGQEVGTVEVSESDSSSGGDGGIGIVAIAVAAVVLAGALGGAYYYREELGDLVEE